ncbi:MAG: zinc-ribbon domain-containing protein [Pseudomonadota bacterium]
MRLICPNCDAQYEVGEGIIPDEGRDVQCSNCGHTWFHLPSGRDPIATGAAAVRPRTAKRVSAHPAPEPIEDEEEFEAALQAALSDGDSSDAPGPKTASERKRLDPDIANILREEAAREAEARRSKPQPGVESQPDLGLEETGGRSGRAAVLQRSDEGVETFAADAETATSGKRRELLPDIEEINSTLRPTVERAYESSGPTAVEMTGHRSRRAGFRLGFSFAVVCALGAAGIYVFAPKLIERVPEAGPALDGYVAMVDRWRLELDGTLRRTIELAQSLTVSEPVE